MAIRWTQEVEGGPRRVNHAAVSIRNRFIFSFGGYCTGEEYNQIVNIDVHVFDTGKFVEFEVNIARLWFIVFWPVCSHLRDFCYTSLKTTLSAVLLLNQAVFSLFSFGLN